MQMEQPDSSPSHTCTHTPKHHHNASKKAAQARLCSSVGTLEMCTFRLSSKFVLELSVCLPSLANSATRALTASCTTVAVTHERHAGPTSPPVAAAGSRRAARVLRRRPHAPPLPAPLLGVWRAAHGVAADARRDPRSFVHHHRGARDARVLSRRVHHQRGPRPSPARQRESRHDPSPQTGDVRGRVAAGVPARLQGRRECRGRHKWPPERYRSLYLRRVRPGLGCGACGSQRRDCGGASL